eukprot:TRINITY_DN103057_c0_g1_i1.p1 TRINITY_DN103057_c0_g1~~TRINITY_DN103057_c0_g1_i1.p1  ORF type:complete len:403 (-),score=56.51 TRINITY_DN103057_c0_g1_i1:20-1228(-)
MPGNKARARKNTQRPSPMSQEGIAPLQGDGPGGEEHELVAVNFNLREVGNLPNGEHATNLDAVASLSSIGEHKQKHVNGKGASGYGATDEAGHRQSYAQLSQRHQSPHVSLIRDGCDDLPTGVHYEAGVGRSCETYDIDVVRMQQTHVETGSIRKIRREKKGVWRFDKKGSTWGIYPGIVSVELERIFLALGRRGLLMSSENDRKSSSQKVREESSQADTDPYGFSEVSLNDLERRLSLDSFTPESLASACELLFSSAEAGGLLAAARAADLLESFAAGLALRCTADHVRRAGLVVGSMRLLQAVLRSAPNLQLVGIDIFDRKYPKLSLQDVGRKNCVRCLLSRGMRLGSSTHVPQGKLLRKVEADAEPAWTERYLDCMMTENPQLPEWVRIRVLEWIAYAA